MKHKFLSMLLSLSLIATIFAAFTLTASAATFANTTYSITYNANDDGSETVSGMPENQSQANSVVSVVLEETGTIVTYVSPFGSENFLWSGSDGGSYRTNWAPDEVMYRAQIGKYNSMGMRTATYRVVSANYSSVELTVSSDKPSREGYTFASWNTSADGTGDTVAAGATYENESITLYAQWTPQTGTITVSANPTAGGSISGGGTVANGKNVNLLATANTGYSFTGWSDGDTTNPRTVTVTGNATYTANFAPITYTVLLNTNGGALKIVNLTEYTYGTGATLPTASDLSYESFTFAGWYENSDFTGNAVTVIPANATGNKEYFAKWTANVTASGFATTTDSGYYSEAVDSETKKGVVVFNSLFNQYETYERTISSFGLYLYRTGNEVNKISLDSTNTGVDATDLTDALGYFYGTVEEIAEADFEDTIVAMPYVVIKGQTYYGDVLTGSVNPSKWLGEKTAE